MLNAPIRGRLIELGVTRLRRTSASASQQMWQARMSVESLWFLDTVSSYGSR